MPHSTPPPHRDNVDAIAFTLKVKIRIGLIAFLVAGVTTLIYSQLDDEQRQVANFGATAFGVSIAGVSAIHAYRGIIATQAMAEKNRQEDRALEERKRREDRAIEAKNRVLERTKQYISGWNHSSLTAKKATIKIIIAEAKSENMRILRYLNHSSKSKQTQDIVDVLNFLEEVSYFALEGDLDKAKLATYYRDIFDVFYDELYQFIQDRREERSQKNLYKCFETLHHEWHVNNR